jgi:MFS family permease
MSEERNQNRIFIASFMTLIAAGVGFAVRGGILDKWGASFGFTKSELGLITGSGLVGFGVVILFASMITDRLGYKPILVIAFLLHGLSAVVTLAATWVFATWGREATYWCLVCGGFMYSTANGLCEAVINPLTADLYPHRKTHYLNILHAGWPGGLILGGLIGKFMSEYRWEIPMGAFLVPTLIYGVMILPARFPESHVSKAGVSLGESIGQLFHPVLIFLLILHACVGYVELGTDSWINRITESIIVNQGFYLFIYASAIMFVLRFFAGPIVERINPLGLLFASACLGSIGLFLIGSVGSVAMMWVAVTIYGLGKTFLWPTMLGVVGERFPRGGAITMGAMGGIGMLSAGLLGSPGIGFKQDYFASQALQESSTSTYERYASDKENTFLGVFKVKGLDGAKVGIISEIDKSKDPPERAPAKSFLADLATVRDLNAKAPAEEQKPIPKEVIDLETWWNDSGKPNADVDLPQVEEATKEGGRQALKWTALVPAAMAIGYLLLLIYFRATGGYRQKSVTETEEG